VAKPGQSPGGLALHGADRIAEDLRGLRLRQLVPVAQHDHRPLPLGQPPQRHDQAVPVGDHVVEQGRHLGWQFGGMPLTVLPAARTPPLIVGRVDDRAPGVRQRLIDPPPAQVQPGQRFLGGVLRPAPVTTQHERQAD
jgi:hypothetical protein